MTARGFAVEVVFCAMCGETAEALPDGSVAMGLPVGWVAVQIGRYRKIFSGPNKPYDDQRTLYYCSEAHLPAELMPREEGA